MKSAILAAVLALAATAPSLAAEAGHDQAATLSETERNRAIVADFFDMFYIQKKTRAAFEKHMAADYIQHNPMAPDGREATLAVLEPFLATVPNVTYKIQRIIVDRDLATVHSHMIPAPGERGYAVVDIVRLKDGKIVEHWDVLQPVPEKSANPHPMF